MARVFTARVYEQGDVTILGRVTARDGSGDWTNVQGEGRFLQQADLSSIECRVFDLEDNALVAEPEVEVSDVILDDPDKSGEIWRLDLNGYNFRHDFPGEILDSPDTTFRVEYKFITTADSVTWGVYELETARILSTGDFS